MASQGLLVGHCIVQEAALGGPSWAQSHRALLGLHSASVFCADLTRLRNVCVHIRPLLCKKARDAIQLNFTSQWWWGGGEFWHVHCGYMDVGEYIPSARGRNEIGGKKSTGRTCSSGGILLETLLVKPRVKRSETRGRGRRKDQPWGSRPLWPFVRRHSGKRATLQGWWFGMAEPSNTED